ncbi:MAG: biotin transporter BioY, partial [Eggerthellaceae bacterium]|nr:biotin transporter BioY [Eggerthellaceae bacterium]
MMEDTNARREGTSSFALAVDALLCALLILSCLVTIPLGPVPFTLQTAVMVVIVLLRRPRDVALITGAYLIMGAVGLPVFSGMSGGIVRASTGFLAAFFVGGVAASA